MAVDLQHDPVGTPHPSARCCWCQAALVVGVVVDLRCWLCPTCWPRQIAQALIVQPNASLRVCLNVPLPSQVLFEECPAKNILWGGQAGPGKSHGVRWWLYKRSLMIPDHKAVLLRENSKQLETTHLFDMKRELPKLDGKLVDDVARFSNGAEIHCGHMADEAAVQRYLGTEYGAIVGEEGSLYPVNSQGASTLSELRTRARKNYVDINGQIVPPKFVVPSNPGGPSSPYLCDMFVDHQPDYERYPRLRPVFNELGVQIKGYRPEQWAYLPARLEDNPYLREDYRDSDLAGLSDVRYKQLAEGDWHAFHGAFFGEWSETREGQPWHVRRFAA